MSSSNSPCAACKLQRRKCTQECVFAPYFPPDNPQRFAYVHKVFGASNVAKILNELNAAQRDDAVKSLAYEAEARLRDPVYGCVGLISVLQQRLKAIQAELSNAKKELATFIGPQAFQPMASVLAPHGMIAQQQHHQGNPYGPSLLTYNNMPPLTMAGVPPGTAAVAQGGQLVIREPHQQHQHQHQHHQHAQQQMLEAQQLAAVMGPREQQEMFEGYDQQQQEFLRFNGGGGFEMGSVSGSGFSQPAEMSPSLALGSFENTFQQMQLQQGEGAHHHHHQPPQSHHQLQAQLLLPPPQPQPQTQQHHHQQQSESEEGRSVGPC